MNPSRPTHMQALRVHAFDGPQHWRVEPMPVPEVAPQQLLIQVHASGISFVDLLLARGGYQVKPQLPMTPGTEFSGVIAAVGSALTDAWSIGQAVAGTTFGGSWAQYALADPQSVIAIPNASDLTLAADLGITGATAVHALHDRAQLRAGETVLVLGAAGGVGLASVQVAKAMGARVIASASSPAKRELAQHMGADVSLDSRDAHWRDALRAIAPQGIDVVVDPVGGAMSELAFRSLAWNGRHLVIGFAAGEIPKLKTNLALLKGAALIGVDIRQFPLQQPQAAIANLQRTGALFASGKLRPHVARVLPFAHWPEAIAQATAPETLGKVVMRWA